MHDRMDRNCPNLIGQYSTGDWDATLPFLLDFLTCYAFTNMPDKGSYWGLSEQWEIRKIKQFINRFYNSAFPNPNDSLFFLSIQQEVLGISG